MRNFMIMIAMFFIKMYLKLVYRARTIFLDFNHVSVIKTCFLHMSQVADRVSMTVAQSIYSWTALEC